MNIKSYKCSYCEFFQRFYSLIKYYEGGRYPCITANRELCSTQISLSVFWTKRGLVCNMQSSLVLGRHSSRGLGELQPSWGPYSAFLREDACDLFLSSFRWNWSGVLLLKVCNLQSHRVYQISWRLTDVHLTSSQCHSKRSSALLTDGIWMAHPSSGQSSVRSQGTCYTVRVGATEWKTWCGGAWIYRLIGWNSIDS